MAAYYLDTSALVKRYVTERGSSWVEALVVPDEHDLYTGRLTAVEMIAALSRKARTGGTTPAEAAHGIHTFRHDWPRDYLILEITPQVADRAMDLAEAHGLRGYDAVHLGAALDLHEERRTAGLPTLIFVSADNDQRQAAAAEGLPVEDPNAHP
ncbi:MAG: type II toxin-antitoxin system VapC family toxin [Chloroflexi bacterium]|nr:type II toxin-antitoxin system VapC family toxin [Chloroflexota bacterium]